MLVWHQWTAHQQSRHRARPEGVPSRAAAAEHTSWAEQNPYRMDHPRWEAVLALELELELDWVP